MWSIQNTILSTSFQTNLFISALGGSLIFGRVQLQEGVLGYLKDESVILHHRKFTEFLAAIKALAANIVTATDKIPKKNQVTIELSKTEYLVIEKQELNRKWKGATVFTLQFDQFLLFDFVTGLTQLAIFITNPSPSQYELVQKYIKQRGKLEHMSFKERVLQLWQCETETKKNEFEKFLLTQYLCQNEHIVEFIFETNCLSGCCSAIN